MEGLENEIKMSAYVVSFHILCFLTAFWATIEVVCLFVWSLAFGWLQYLHIAKLFCLLWAEPRL